MVKTTISIEPETRRQLAILKETYHFSDYDALINALMKNTEILKGMVKNE